MAKADPMCISYSVMDGGKETSRLLRALEVTAKRAESESSGCAVAVPPEGTVARTEQVLMWSQARMKISTLQLPKEGKPRQVRTGHCVCYSLVLLPWARPLLVPRKPYPLG